MFRTLLVSISGRLKHFTVSGYTEYVKLYFVMLHPRTPDTGQS